MLASAVDAFVSAFREADESQRAYGATWYEEARREARSIARDTGRTLSCVAGVIAALSPRAHWKTNLVWARKSCETGVATGSLKMSIRKAALILSGVRPLKALRGLKVRAFYRALIGEQTAAVIDVWMTRAAGLDNDALTPYQYGCLARACILGAVMVSVPVTTFQATVWVVVRGRHD